MGFLTPEGNILIVDRKKDMINVSGLKVFAQEVENVVNQHDRVVESGAIAIDDKDTGEAVGLFVVPKDTSLKEKDIINYCKKSLTAYKIPKVVKFIDEIPKSIVGKLLRRELRKYIKN